MTTDPSRDREGADKPSGQRERPDNPSRDREGAESSARPRKELPNIYCDARAYLITFTTYATWVHGDERGSVDREHNIPGTALLSPSAPRRRMVTGLMKSNEVKLNREQRTVIQKTIDRVCAHFDWELHTVNVRTNHVHIVVSAPESPERVMNVLKSWTTRALVAAKLINQGSKMWTRHGSTRYLWKDRDVRTACQYVCEGQGVDL
jgi:REP element-mobilizing transposase RayT